MNDFEHLDQSKGSATSELVELIRERFLLIVSVGLLVFALAMYAEYDPQIPRFWKVAGLAGIFVVPWGYLLGQKVLELLYDPKMIYLIDLDARELDGALYAFPFAQFSRLELRKGEMTQLTPNLYTAKDVDLEELEATGTWRGTLDDRELCIALSAVYDCRGELEKEAQKGLMFEASGLTILRTAVRDVSETILETFESGTLPDGGDGFQKAIDDALDQFDIEQKVESELEDETPDVAEASSDLADDLADGPEPAPAEVAADD